MKIHFGQLKYLIPVIAFGFLIYQARDYINDIPRSISDINYVLLFISYIVLLFVFITDALGWHLILKCLTCNARFSSTLPIWFYSAFSRYIPGVIWPYAVRIKLSSDAGIDKYIITNSMLLENAFLALTAIITGIPLAFKTLGFTTTLVITIVPLAALIAAKLFLHKIPNQNKVPEMINKLIKNLQQTRVEDIFKLTIFYSLFWMVFSATFGLFCVAITNSASLQQHLFYVSACFPVSFFIGFIATISPGGLGIRESALYSLLVLFIEPTDAVLIAIASRIWIVSAEISVGIMLALRYHSKMRLKKSD
ncbi:MAG: lysylphosphatidylglycerol synthase transmembrane domain-containing protein [Gammaproteobacteria bacterium]